MAELSETVAGVKVEGCGNEGGNADYDVDDVIH
jgi:hypothetical protein